MNAEIALPSLYRWRPGQPVNDVFLCVRSVRIPWKLPRKGVLKCSRCGSYFDLTEPLPRCPMETI
jgi:hypothetical protein